MDSKLLRQVRKERGITQEYMAKQLGYKGKSGYSVFESGKVKVDLERTLKIKKILRLSKDEYNSIFFDQKSKKL